MSDRIAVFNAGRIEQVGTPAEVYERPATRFVAGFVGHVEPAHRRRWPSGHRARRHVHGPPREDPPRGDRMPAGRGRRGGGDGHDPGRRLPRAGHPLHRGAGRRGPARRHPAEPRDDLDRGARAEGHGCPPGLEATARACPSPMVPIEPRRRTGAEEEEASCGHRRLAVGLVSGGLVAAARTCGVASGAVTVTGDGPSVRRPLHDRRPRRSAKARASSTSSRGSGYVGGRREPSRSRLGHRIRGRRPAARSPSRSTAPRTRWSRCHDRPAHYDGVSASGDATLRLDRRRRRPAGRHVDLIPELRGGLPGPQGQAHNTVDGVHYGVPHGRGANILMWRTDEVTTAPDQLGRGVRAAASRIRGQGHRLRRPDLHRRRGRLPHGDQARSSSITNPYALDDTQFEAAVDLLKAQAPAVGEYWSPYTEQIDSFPNGNTVIGTTWQVRPTSCRAEPTSRSRRSSPRKA